MRSTLGGVFGLPDGINEAGLSIASLWLPVSQYPLSQSSTNPVIYNSNLVDWALGNFDTVESLQSAINSITVANINEIVSQLNLPLHYVVSDSSGANIIIEFTNQSMQVYESNNAVLTNAPAYPYHNVATPLGSILPSDFASASTDKPEDLDYTQWGVIRDHKELVYYFFTQFNNNLFSVDLKKIDFSQAQASTVSVIQPNWQTDITSSLS